MRTQEELKEGDGPIALVLAPTRKLIQQIYGEAKKFGKVYGLNVRRSPARSLESVRPSYTRCRRRRCRRRGAR